MVSLNYHSDSKKKADEELNREIGVINEEEVCTDKENTDQNGKPIRNRKRKTYGDEFEETAEDEETNKEGNDGVFYIYNYINK